VTPPDLAHLAWSGARLVTGWGLLPDAGRLTRLGAGDLQLDLRLGGCRHGVIWIPPLAIGPLLRARLTAALAEVELGWTDLVRADLAIRYQLREQPQAPSPMAAWSGFEGPMIGCSLDVALTLATGAGHWSGTHRGHLAWPRTWALRQ